jgi:4-diphosphocytidyl-2-C-methyl-D-erythritol kinase
MSGSGPTCFALFKDINIANEVFEQNHKMFNNNGFEAWVCKLINSGITFL